MNPNPSIAIIGAGAVGGYYGARLAQHGHDVHFLLRSDYEHVRAHGLTIRSVAGDFSLPADRIHVYDDPAAMPKVDLVLVTLKTTENHQLPRLIPPLLHEETTIVALQNGVGNEAELAQLFGASRIVGGIAFVCINRTGPGVIEHLDHGFLRFGEFALASGASRSDRVSAIVKMFQAAGVRASAVDDLHGARWEKLVWNIPFNGLGAVLDLTTDRLIDSDAGVRLVTAVMREVIAAAAADGVRLSDDLPAEKIAVTRTMGAYRTSTQIDRATGRAIELEAIFGRPLRVAQQAGVPAPLMEFIHFALSRR
jgi:2-dehydropantoate 2-reductase